MFGKPLNTLSNSHKPMYIAHKKGIRYDDYDNELPIYEEPFFYNMVNYMPLVGNELEAYTKAYGETTNSIVRCFVDYTDTNLFHEFDIAYLYGNTPDGEIQIGDNANYIIRAVKEQNTKTMILLEEIVKGDISNGESQNN